MLFIIKHYKQIGVFVFIGVGIFFFDLKSMFSCFLNGGCILFSFVAGFLHVGNLCYCLDDEDLLNNTDKINISTENQSEVEGSETPSEPEKETQPPFWRRKSFWLTLCGSTLVLGLFIYFGFGWDGGMGMVVLADHLPYLYRSSEYLYESSARALRIVMRQVDFNSNPVDPDRQAAFELINTYSWNGVAAAIGATISTFAVNVDVYGLSDKDFLNLIKYIATIYKDVDTQRLLPMDVGKSIDDWVRALPKD